MLTKEKVLEQLGNVHDPELGMSITDLGLVYRVEIFEDKKVEVDFTLTYPGCPAADIIYQDIEFTLQNNEEISDSKINIVWDPPWSIEKMSDEAKISLGYPV